MCYLKGFQTLCSASTLEMLCRSICFLLLFWGCNPLGSDRGDRLNAARPCETERGEGNGVAHHQFSGISVTVETCFSLYLLFAGTASLIRHELCLSSSSSQIVILKTSKILSIVFGRGLGSSGRKMCFRTGGAAVSPLAALL